MKRLPGIFLLLLMVVMATGGLGSAGKPRKPTHVITIENMRFSPASIRVLSGDWVEFRNVDLVPHNVTEQGSKRFDSGMIERNQSWSFLAGEAGEFGYDCIYHSQMKGVIVVGETAITTPSRPAGAVELCR